MQKKKNNRRFILVNMNNESIVVYISKARKGNLGGMVSKFYQHDFQAP